MSILGYVQAGGASRRFGRDKALVGFGGRTMLAQTTGLLASVCGEVIIVAAEGQYPDALVPLLADRWPGQGPLGGILTALQSSALRGTESIWNLIVSCDMPFLTRDWLEFLCQRAERSAAQVAVAESANGLEPLCACWKTTSMPSVQAAFDSGVRKVSDAMKRLPMEVLDVSVWKRFDTKGRLFWNVNTPADYEEAKRILEVRQP
ncbi:MAG TPA: molybdenum cofactor guanylyltransferase [Candidatus Acidoferrum sp.]|jgi:molybdopterin-guanine dinucleotide biosynthesis protein A|nr:molybdenum cofactor guanylyltransferase [Candidatus Acidoferrum sp.]